MRVRKHWSGDFLAVIDFRLYEKFETLVFSQVQVAGEEFGGLEEFVFDHHVFVVAEVVGIEGLVHESRWVSKMFRDDEERED